MAILRHRAVRATWCHKRYKFAEKIARAPSCTVFQGELYGHREGLVIRNLGGEEQQQQQHNGKTTPTAKNGNDFGIALESFWP